MAEIVLRTNLSAANFPLVSDWQGRTIIIPRFDQNFQKSAIFAGADDDRDVGIPQVFYLENCMPTEQGFQSIGYDEALEPSTLEPNFDSLFTLRDANQNITLWSPAGGLNYVYGSPDFTWSSISPVAGVQSSTVVTSTYLKGVQYCYYGNIGAYVYDAVLQQFTATPLTGLIPTVIKGLTSSNNYLIAWDLDSIYWSSLVDPTDFVPSLSTGAGAITPSDIKGGIVVCLQISGGFIIYTTANAVSATYTGNVRNPWIFKEVANSGGITSPQQVSYEANLLQHYALTTSGLQKLDKNQAVVEDAQISDFLNGRTFEYWDRTLNAPVQQYLSAPMQLKLAVVANRYLVLSYGVNALTHALVYDIPMKRWGKLKIDHVDCFTYTQPNIFGLVSYTGLINSELPYFQLEDISYTQLLLRTESQAVPKKSIGFLRQDGSITVLDFDLTTACDAVFMLGKYQFERTSIVTLLSVETENTVPPGGAGSTELRVLSSLRGKVFTSNLPPRYTENEGEQIRSFFRVTAMNHSIVWLGTFNLNSLILTMLKAGAR